METSGWSHMVESGLDLFFFCDKRDVEFRLTSSWSHHKHSPRQRLKEVSVFWRLPATIWRVSAATIVHCLKQDERRKSFRAKKRVPERNTPSTLEKKLKPFSSSWSKKIKPVFNPVVLLVSTRGCVQKQRTTHTQREKMNLFTAWKV